VRRNDPCTKMTIILDGYLASEEEDTNGQVILSADCAIGSSCFTTLNAVHDFTFVCKSDKCYAIELGKKNYAEVLYSYR